MQEKIIETKTCKHCNSNFEVTNKDLEFYEKVSPVFDLPQSLLSKEGSSSIPPLSKGRLGGVLDVGEGKIKYLIPLPTLCPTCREQRRMSFRNERKLYHRKCDATGNQIISIYSPDKPYKVYDKDFWWSDKWEALDYGKDFDFARGFFEQFQELNLVVPKLSLVVIDNENSPYVNFVGYSKNIYMCGDVMHSENVYYSNMIKNTTNSCDVYDLQNSHNCYMCIGCQNLTNCKYVNWSSECSNCYYIDSCHNLNNCLFCVNLNNKNNYILNKEVSKEEYKKVLDLINNNDFSSYLEEYKKLLLNSPRNALRTNNIENSSGELIKNAKDSQHCYQSINIENCKYVTVGQDMFNCMDTTIHNPECYLDYEAISGGYLKFALSNSFCGHCNHIYYCFECLNSSNLFGCSGLRNKEYCILNKQYTKKEYEELVPKIIEHMQTPLKFPLSKEGKIEWGEFFPSLISPFGYNETVAMEYYPINQENTKGLFNWSDYEKQNGYSGEYYKPLEIKYYNEKIVPKEIADKNIFEALNGIINCEKTSKPFRLVKSELEFYIKNNINIPHRHPDVRHLDRMALRNPRKLFARICDKCHKDIKTTYSPERPEIVYCEECYNQEVY